MNKTFKVIPSGSEDQLFTYSCIALSLCYVALILHLPVTFLPLAQHDDGWFISKAASIFSGGWFGSYNQNTLIKGGAYPLFLAVNRLIGLPITLSQALLFCGAVMFIGYACRRLGLNWILALICVALILFQPALFPVRITRENIYSSLMLISLASFIFQTTSVATKARIFYSVLSGVAFAFFLYTREEGLWFIPSAILLISFSVWRSPVNVCLKSRVSGALASLSGLFLIVGGVSLLNFSYYGVNSLVDFKSKEFRLTLDTLNSIDIGSDTQFVPVSKQKRAIAYTVSPSFRQLQPFLEDPSNPWLDPSCEVYKTVCGDFAGGWFMWALRDAAAMAGYFQSHSVASEFFQSVNDELLASCESDQISCTSSLIPFMPRLTADGRQQLGGELMNAISLITYMHPNSYSLASGRSELRDDKKSRAAMIFVGLPYIVPEKLKQPMTAKINGWFYSADDDWVQLMCSDGNRIIQRRSSDDIARAFDDSRAVNNRFSILISNFESCRFQTIANKHDFVRVASAVPARLVSGDGSQHLHLESVEINDGSEWKTMSWLDTKKALARFASVVSPVLLGVGLASTAVLSILVLIRRRDIDLIFVVAVSCWGAIIIRSLLMALIEVTAFPTMNFSYLGPVYALMPLASVLSFGGLLVSRRKVER